MVITLDDGTEYSWDEGVEFSIVWHGRRYGFRNNWDAQEAYWLITDELRSNVDGVFVGMTDEYVDSNGNI